MSTTTPILGLRYPIDTDNPGTLGVHTAIQHMAEDLDQYFGAWTGWTPTIGQGATSNIAKTVNNARFRAQGKLCEFQFKCSMTGTGTAAAKVTVSAPATARAAVLVPVGFGKLFDTSAGSSFDEMMWLDTSATAMIYRTGAGSLGAAGFTAALASGDVLEGAGFLELP